MKLEGMILNEWEKLRSVSYFSRDFIKPVYNFKFHDRIRL